MSIPQGVGRIHFGESPAPYKPVVALPSNPMLGCKASTPEQAFANLQEHFSLFARFWSEQATSDQLEYCARLATGDTAGDDMALWLPEGFLNQQGRSA